MALTKHCKHTKMDGLCKACKEKKPFHEFRGCPTNCFNCKECGYFYGSAAPEDLQGRQVPQRPKTN